MYSSWLSGARGSQILDIDGCVEYTNGMPDPTTDVWEVLSTARSIRRFTDEPVDDATLERCLQAATWAPNGANAQLWRFIVLDAPEQRAAVAEAAQIALRSIESIYGMSRPDNEDQSRAARNNRATYELHDRAGEYTSVLFAAFKNEFSSEFLQGGSIYPAMQNFYLAARAQGLGACITSWASYDGDKVLRASIGIPDEWFLAGHIVVGWPRGKHGPVRRRPLSDVVFRNHWNPERADITYGRGARPRR
ncbi:nitroreductase [Mycolicibacterium conceptionense]|jgi:nitroreductase|uniref:Nitroreductase n=3 Tax=Mycolicibacterium TaxID=1866885 RepID=A0A0U1DBM7_9MYCO|nr:nitroreductase [Mycolicibacterium conceptionense]